MTGTTLACPDCDRGGLARTRSATFGRKSDADEPEYWCDNCETHVDGVERERKTHGADTCKGLSKRLLDMDPEDV